MNAQKRDFTATFFLDSGKKLKFRLPQEESCPTTWREGQAEAVGLSKRMHAQLSIVGGSSSGLREYCQRFKVQELHYGDAGRLIGLKQQ